MKPVIASSALCSLAILFTASASHAQNYQSSSDFNPFVKNYAPPASGQPRYIPAQNRTAPHPTAQRPTQTLAYNSQQQSAAPRTAQSAYGQPAQSTAYAQRQPGLQPQSAPISSGLGQPLGNYGADQSSSAYPAAARTGQKPWYAGLRLFVSSLEDLEGSERLSPTTVDSSLAEFDTGYGLGILGGYRVNRNFRLEGEISYQDYEVDSARVTRSVNGAVTSQTGLDDDNLGFEAWTVMANGYFDLPIPNYPQYTPYIGGGVGGMFQRNGAEENSFAYQAMVGVNYGFNNDETTAGVGYRYLVAPDILDSDALHFDAETHALEFTIRQQL